MTSNNRIVVYPINVKDALLIKNDNSAIALKEKGDSIGIIFYLNLNDDVANVVEKNIPIERAKDFEPCIRQFGTRKIIPFYDAEQNVGLEVGYDIGKEICIFFELIDYSFDSSCETTLPKKFVLNVLNTDPNFNVLNSVLQFIKGYEKERTDDDECRFDRSQYQRSCGL